MFKFIIVDTLQIYQFFKPDFLDEIVKSQVYNLFPDLFLNDMNIYDGDTSQIDPSRSEVYVTHFPSGAGWKCFLHFSQAIGKEEFLRYDYSSPTRNLEVYGTRTPPAYNLTNVTLSKVPIALFAGE